MRFQRLVALLALTLAACDCGAEDPPPVEPPSGTEGSTCATAQQCNSPLVCVDSICTMPMSGGDASVDADSGEDVGMDTSTPDSAPLCDNPTDQCGEACCTDGESCFEGACCAEENICDGVCCGGDRTCVTNRCVLDCGDNPSCGNGDDAICCESGDVCYLGSCTVPGAACERTSDCDDTSYCEPSIGACLPRADSGEECEYRPEVSAFDLEEEWAWESDPEVFPAHNQVMMAPMVANLNDDNEDGVIDQNDIPDVVFNTFTGSNYRNTGILRAVSGADGSRLWPATEAAATYRTVPGAEVAIADVDPASPGPEVIACSGETNSGHLLIISAAGQELRRFDEAPNIVTCAYGAPAVGDMDGDGVPEIVHGYTIAHGDGTLVRQITTGAPYTALYNVDADPDLELVSAAAVYDMDGTVLWDRLTEAPGRPAIPRNATVALADLDLDGQVEIVLVDAGTHSIMAVNAATGDTVWGPTDINPAEVADRIATQMAARPDRNAATGGGPPTIANFDDDPEPEIAFAGGYAYVIFEPNGERKWFVESRDISSRVTGSSIFDFEGDGVGEVLYNDELSFRVLRGPDGTVYQERCNTSGTIREYPIVVDVDNDDHAEIVLMENNYAFRTCSDGSMSTTGIHVFGHPDNQWVRTRRIWNQHTYHVTNINEDGTVPAREEANHTNPRLNNFRQNVQPNGLFDAPDLVLADLQTSTAGCPASIRVSARVVNEGRASAPAGVPVTFYESGVRVGRGVTTAPLLAGASELVEMMPAFDPPAGRELDAFDFTARVNDPEDEPLPGLNECRDGNNDAAGSIEVSCADLE